MTTIGEAVSRVRNVLKAVKEDSFITDRFIYSIIIKYAKTLMYRDNKLLNLFLNSSLFREDPCVELIDVDRIAACCVSINTGCTFKRSKNKLPSINNLDTGPIIKAITTLDYSVQAHRTEPSVYMTITKTSSFRYNKNKYYWIIDGYLFIPDVDWEAVRIQAMFDEPIKTDYCFTAVNLNICTAEQDRDLNIPEHLFSEIENMVRQEILLLAQIPSDGADDSKSNMR